MGVGPRGKQRKKTNPLRKNIKLRFLAQHENVVFDSNAMHLSNKITFQ